MNEELLKTMIDTLCVGDTIMIELIPATFVVKGKIVKINRDNIRVVNAGFEFGVDKYDITFKDGGLYINYFKHRNIGK